MREISQDAFGQPAHVFQEHRLPLAVGADDEIVKRQRQFDDRIEARERAVARPHFLDHDAAVPGAEDVHHRDRRESFWRTNRRPARSPAAALRRRRRGRGSATETDLRETLVHGSWSDSDSVRVRGSYSADSCWRVRALGFAIVHRRRRPPTELICADMPCRAAPNAPARSPSRAGSTATRAPPGRHSYSARLRNAGDQRAQLLTWRSRRRSRRDLGIDTLTNDAIAMASRA